MKKNILILCSMLITMLLVACGNNVDDATSETYIAKGKEVVSWINDGQYESVTAQFDETMKANLSATQLAEIKPVIEASGAFQEIKKQSVEEKDGLKVVVLVAQHEQEKRIYTITYNSNDQIAGLFIQ